MRRAGKLKSSTMRVEVIRQRAKFNLRERKERKKNGGGLSGGSSGAKEGKKVCVYPDYQIRIGIR